MPLIPVTNSGRTSRTILAGLAQLIPSIVGLVLHYTGAVPMDGELLGAAYTGLLTGASTIYLRSITSEPLAGADQPPRRRRGGPPGVMALIVALSTLAIGCAPMGHVRAAEVDLGCDAALHVAGEAVPSDLRDMAGEVCRVAVRRALMAAGVAVVPEGCPR